MSSEAGQELGRSIDGADGDLRAIQTFLDSLSHRQRLEAIRSLGLKRQRELWRLADGFMPLALVDLVPAGVPPLTPVRHYGKNSMPVFSLFEKRFYRPGAEGDTLGGANFQSLSPLTGPGYYVATEDRARGEVLIDYRRLPETAPDGWPPIASNERGPSRLVYGFMVDTLRRVSEHVTIGRAARRDKDMNAWFVLCREPLASDADGGT